MSNIANPGCCCDIGPYYPWLCYETGTLSNGSISGSGQIVRVPVVTVSFQGYGSGGVPVYNPMSSYVSGDKVYITSGNTVYTATGVVGLSGVPSGPFNSLANWNAGVAIADQDVDKYCAPLDGSPVVSTAEKHYVKFDVFSSSGSPIDEVANMTLRTPGVSYAWHIVEDKRLFSSFSESASYVSGDLISLAAGTGCAGHYTCHDSLYEDDKCCQEWKATGSISAGEFDASDGWVPEDPNASKYHLILADWSQPEAWISGEPAATIATRNISKTGLPAANDPFVNYEGSGLGYGINQIPTPSEDFMLSRNGASSQQNLMFRPYSKSVFMSTTMSDLSGPSRSIRGRGWGNTYANVLSTYTYADCQTLPCEWGPVSDNEGCTMSPCNKNHKAKPKGGDAPGGGSYGSETEANISTISADDTDFYYFEIVPLETAIDTPILCGECDDCDDGANDNCHGPIVAGKKTQCTHTIGDYPQEEGSMRRKIVVQHWQRDGDTINYLGNLPYPDCSGNWKGHICLYGRNAVGNYPYNPRTIESCDPMDCNPPSASSYAWNSDKFQFSQYNGCTAVRPADIIYTFDGVSSEFGKVKHNRVWWGDGDIINADSCACTKPQKYGVTQYESLPHIYAISHRIPMRSLSITTRQWGATDGYIESGEDPLLKSPSLCMMANHQCKPPYRCKKVNNQWVSACKKYQPKRAGCSPSQELLPGRYDFELICEYTAGKCKDSSTIPDGTIVGPCKSNPCGDGECTNYADESHLPICKYSGQVNSEGMTKNSSNAALWAWTECQGDGWGNKPVPPKNGAVYNEACQNFSNYIHASQSVPDQPNVMWENGGSIFGLTAPPAWWHGAWYTDPDTGEDSFYYATTPPVANHSFGGVTFDVQGFKIDTLYPTALKKCTADGQSLSDEPNPQFGKWSNTDNTKTFADICGIHSTAMSLLEPYKSPAQLNAGEGIGGCHNNVAWYTNTETEAEIAQSFLSCGWPITASDGRGWPPLTSRDYKDEDIAKFLSEHCCYCKDSWGGVNVTRPAQLKGFQEDQGWRCLDSSYPGLKGQCSVNNFQVNCRKLDNLTNNYDIYTDLIAGYPTTGSFNTGSFSSYHHNNKNLYYGVTGSKVWSKRYKFNARPYVFNELYRHSFTPKLGVTLYGYDAAQEGIDTYGANDITDMVAHTLVDPQRIQIDYHDERFDTPMHWIKAALGKGSNFYPDMEYAQNYTNNVHNSYLPVCINGANFTQCSDPDPPTFDNPDITKCGDMIGSDCKTIEKAANTYGAPQTFFQKYKLWNKLFITDPTARAIYALEEYDCNKQYNEGDIVEYDGCQWVAQKQTFNPSGVWVGDPDYQHAERYNCGKQYAKGDLVRHESGNYTLIWEANENTKDPLTGCPECSGSLTPPQICAYDCDATYASGDQAIFSGTANTVQYIWTANQPVETGNCITYPEYDCSGRYSKGDKVTYNDKFYVYCTGDTPISECCSPCVEGTFTDFNCTGSYEAGDLIKYDCRTYEATGNWGPYNAYNCSGSYDEGDVVSYNGNIYVRNTTAGCFGQSSISGWSPNGPSEGGVGSNNAYPSGYVVEVQGSECDHCGDNASECWQAQTVDDSATPRQFVENYFYPTSGLTTYWSRCTSSGCCEFNSNMWTLSGTCLTTPNVWRETGVCCDFDTSVWTETGICCEFDYSKWDQGDRAYCCPFESGQWTVLTTGTECNNGCCDFDQIAPWNCYNDYSIGDQVTHEDSNGDLFYWTSNTDIDNIDCEDGCCSFNESQWDKGDSRSPYWKSGELGCAEGMAVEEHWYNTYYHRDADTSESSANDYNPSSTYSKGDTVVYPNPHSGADNWGREHVYTNISYKNTSPASGDLNELTSDGFNYDHWIIGQEASTTSKAKQFEWLDYPNNYPYSKYERRIFEDGVMREAYPFYDDANWFDEETLYGDSTYPSTESVIVVCDLDGNSPGNPRDSDGGYNTLYQWMLSIDPGITWEATQTLTVPHSDGSTATYSGWWVIDFGKQGTWSHQGAWDRTKWRQVGTYENAVRCPTDNRLWIDKAGSKWVTFDVNLTTTVVRVSAWSSLTNTQKENLNTAQEGKRNGCGPMLKRNSNYGYCKLGWSNLDPVTSSAMIPEKTTYELNNWRPVHQPEYFDTNDKMEFSGLHTIDDSSLTTTEKTALPPPTYEGKQWYHSTNLDININALNLSTTAMSNDSLNKGPEMTSSAPALHVAKRSTNGQGLQAAILWDSHYRWDQYDREQNGQRQKYTYLEYFKGSSCEDDDYETIESEVYGNVLVSSWRLRWFDGKNEILSAASPPSHYVMNDFHNRDNLFCQPWDASDADNPQGNRFSPCWQHTTQNNTNTRHYSWMPWMEWSSDNWLFLYNFPLTSKDFENYDIDLSRFAELNDLGQTDGIPWPNEKPQDMELLYPSYIPPARDAYDPNKIGGYPHVIVSELVNNPACPNEAGKVVSSSISEANLLPPSARVLHSDNERDNPLHNRDNSALIESTRKEYTAIAPSTGYPPTWSSTHSDTEGSACPYPIGSIVEVDADPTKTFQAVRIDPLGATEGSSPDTTAGSQYWTHLSDYDASNRAVIAGPWNSSNWFQKDGDGYLWKDWMVSLGDGHFNCGKLWIPIGCRAEDRFTDKQHMLGTTYFGNNIKGGSVDNLQHGNRRYDALGRTVGVPLTPPITDHSQSDEI